MELDLPDCMSAVRDFAASRACTPRARARLYGPDPTIAPNYFELVIFPKLSPERIHQYSKENRLVFPSSYSGILEKTNGLRLFGLDVFGVPADESRLGSSDVVSCVDVSFANRFWSKTFAGLIEPGDFYFASSDISGSEKAAFFVRGSKVIGVTETCVLESYEDMKDSFTAEVERAVRVYRNLRERSLD